jgi:aminoglycoside phosphotransferase (APT) family kinase protein
VTGCADPFAPAAIEERLARVFPLLRISPVRELETGFGSVAVETGEGIVFRIARHAAAAAGHDAEARLLPALATRLPCLVPRPQWRIAPGTAGFPHGAIGYARLEGETLSPVLARNAGVATELGTFLAALHRFPLEEARALGVPEADGDRSGDEELRAAVLPTLHDALEAGEYASIVRWWAAYLADPELVRFPPALRHGDLWYGNVLVGQSGDRIAAVLDWENVAIGDPAKDFAAQGYLGNAFASGVLDGYRSSGGRMDAGLRRRIRHRWEVREFSGIRTALELGDEEELAEGLAKLRAGRSCHKLDLASRGV